MNRLAAMQLWPAFRNRARAACSATFDRSASASTMNGSEPPSSSTHFLSARPAAAPAAANSCSTARAHWGTLGECFSSAPLPAISAGAANRSTCQNGKFHGMMASTTPSGW